MGPDRGIWRLRGSVLLAGTDFIAIGNTFICDLIRRERARSNIDVHVAIYQKLYQSFFESTMSVFEKQYAGFGDTRLMVIKSTWDYAYYWSVLAWLFFRELMTDIAFLKSVQPALLRAQALNATVQLEFRKRASENRSDCGKSRYFDLLAIPLLVDVLTTLTQPGSNPELELGENCRRSRAWRHFCCLCSQNQRQATFTIAVCSATSGDGCRDPVLVVGRSLVGQRALT